MNQVLANVPNLAIFDDHELRDDWGDTATDLDKTGKAYFIAEIAYKLALEYQLQLHADIDFASGTVVADTEPFHSHVFGDLGLFFFDQRGVKSFYSADGDSKPYLGTRQHTHFNSAVGASGAFKDVRALLVLCPVPLVYFNKDMSETMGTQVDDFLGHWSMFENEHLAILDGLRKWKAADSKREVVLLGGDVHISATTAIYHDTKRVFFQLITSSIGNKEISSTDLLATQASMEAKETLPGGYTFEHSNADTPRNFGTVLLKAASPTAQAVATLTIKRAKGEDYVLRSDTDEGTTKIVTGEMTVIAVVVTSVVVLLSSCAYCFKAKKCCFKNSAAQVSPA